MAPNTALTSQKKSDTPYQLDPDQTLRASSALLQHLKKEKKRLEEASAKKNLLAADEDDSDEDSSAEETPVWLQLTTKQHMVDKNRLKPGKITVPHSLNTSSSISICLITADPQRAVKDVVADPSFPSELSSKITRIIGYTKLKSRYHTFESRRQLLNEHDIFLADDRVILRLIETLGKVFYKSHGKRPIPISIARVERDESGKTIKSDKKPGVTKNKEEQYAAVAPPGIVAKEIEKALACIPISIKPGASAALKVGKTSFTPQQLSDNIGAVVKAVTEKYIVKGWRNVKAIHIKGPNTAAMPIWLADELWADENEDVVLEDVIGGAKEAVKQIGAAAEDTEDRGQKRKIKHRLEGDKDRAKRTKAQEKKHEDKALEVARKEKLKGLKQKALSE